MNNPQLFIVSNVVDSLPNILLDVKSLDFLDKVESIFVAHSCFGLQTLSTNNENVFVVELAHREGLSGLLEVREHNPLLRGDREELTSVQRLHKRSATFLVISVRHATENIDVVLELVDYVFSPWVKHAIKWLKK